MTWPERADAPTEAAQPAVALSELEDELESASAALDGLGSGSGVLDIDLTINARWARVEEALLSLKASLRPRKARDFRQAKA